MSILHCIVIILIVIGVDSITIDGVAIIIAIGVPDSINGTNVSVSVNRDNRGREANPLTSSGQISKCIVAKYLNAQYANQ